MLICGARDKKEIQDLKVSIVLEEGCHAPRLCLLQLPGPRTARHVNGRCHFRVVGPRFIQFVRLLTRLARGTGENRREAVGQTGMMVGERYW